MSKISNIDVVVLALGELGGAEKRIHTEVIAEKCQQLSPSQFSWVLPQFRSRSLPDKFVTKCSLEDAMKKKYGSLVEGRTSRQLELDGWSLTIEGAVWLRKNRDRIQEGISGEVVEHHSRRDEKKQMMHYRRHELVASFLKGGSLRPADKYHLFDLLNCSPDAPHEIVEMRVQNFISTVELAGDEEILRFVSECREVFPELFGSAGDGGVV
ncbi:hypothetical protein ACFLR0_02315 [Candidatus Bipolaricaulota bacterium]